MSYQSLTIPRRRRDPNSTHALNSVEHFASSYTRAQSFLAIDGPSGINRARSYLWGGDESTSPNDDSFSAVLDDDSVLDGDQSFEDALDEGASLLSGSPDYSQQLFNRSRRVSVIPLPVDADTYTPIPEDGSVVLSQAQVHPGPNPDSGAGIIVRKVEDVEGHVETSIAGQSTAPQTIFNSVNVLIGVGLLSLSLGFRYSGWVIGVCMMIVSACCTFYSAELLAKCLDTDKTIVTYADIGHSAFGSKARVLISILFTLELTGACVSLVVLFADSLNALIPSVSRTTFKWISFFILAPPSFLPLKILSFSSILGILCTISVVCIVFFDGLYKTTGQPGSLWHPMDTNMWPLSWKHVCLSVGLFMSPWSGHAVFPNIYRDMRHPTKYRTCLITTYEITFIADMAMAVLGFLMFGDLLLEEVSKNIVLTKGYPKFLTYLMTVMLALIPLAKTPLNAQPIIAMLDSTFLYNKSPDMFITKFSKFLIRITVILVFVIMGIVFPDFDRIMSLLGSMLCISICLILPIVFYLKIYAGKISKTEMAIDYVLVTVFSVLAVVGTYASLVDNP